MSNYWQIGVIQPKVYVTLETALCQGNIYTDKQIAQAGFCLTQECKNIAIEELWTLKCDMNF